MPVGMRMKPRQYNVVHFMMLPVFLAHPLAKLQIFHLRICLDRILLMVKIRAEQAPLRNFKYLASASDPACSLKDEKRGDTVCVTGRPYSCSGLNPAFIRKDSFHRPRQHLPPVIAFRNTMKQDIFSLHVGNNVHFSSSCQSCASVRLPL